MPDKPRLVNGNVWIMGNDMPNVAVPSPFSGFDQEARKLPDYPATMEGYQGVPKPPRTLAIKDPAGTFSGKYDPDLIADVISGAKRAKVDPMTGLAMALQETTLGNMGHSANPLNWKPLNGEADLFGPVQGLNWQNMSYQAQRPFWIDAAFNRMKTNQHGVDPSDEELMIQAHNGMGDIQGGSEVSKNQPMYGGQLGLNGRRDRPYGKKVIDLRENALRSNKEIQGLIDIYGQ